MSYNFLLSFIVILSTYIIFRFFRSILNKLAKQKKVSVKRLFYVQKVFEILFLIAAMVAVSFIWSVDLKGVSIFASSLFAIIGVALFAQWSILSNVTASIIIFFTFPARVGDKIRIIDGDNSVEGIIKEISLFQTELKDSENNIVMYPNNLLLQKPVVKVL
ncbi:MAG: small-conductance mechanosensitive channel [Sulfurimonas sp.]